MAKGDRTKAAEVVSLALTDTDGRWRNWGTWTIARRAIKALADEGWTLTPPAHRDGPLLDRPSGSDAGSVDQDAGPGGRAGALNDGLEAPDGPR